MRKLGLTLAALAFAALASPALARDPVVFVSDRGSAGPADSGAAWWIRDMESRPSGLSVAGIPLARLNAWLGPRQGRWCQADAFTSRSFTSDNAALRAEIAGTMRENPRLFATTTRMTGRPLDAIVGNYRTCRGRTAPFLLLVDRSGRAPRIVYLHAMENDWAAFIAVHGDGNRLYVSSCLECGHSEALIYDRRRGRFSWRNVGD